jgi:hypothetical protein
MPLILARTDQIKKSSLIQKKNRIDLQIQSFSIIRDFYQLFKK